MTTPPLPGHPHIAYRDGELCVEGTPVHALAQQYGTPLFVYSQASMHDALAAYQRGFAGRKVQICYAMKANSSLALLQFFARQGCGCDRIGGVGHGGEVHHSTPIAAHRPNRGSAAILALCSGCYSPRA